jgi:hypothetical protein
MKAALRRTARLVLPWTAYALAIVVLLWAMPN